MPEYSIWGERVKLTLNDDEVKAIARVVDLVDRVSRAEAERDTLRQQLAERDATIAEQGRRIERLSAPVSDEEWAHNYDRDECHREACDSIIASRAHGEKEGE
jgi:hypothetical protein